MLLLGILALNTRQRYLGEADLGLVAVAITMLYLIASAGVFVFVTMLPVIRTVLTQRRVSKLFSRLEMHYTQATGLYTIPSTEHPLFTKVDRAADAQLSRNPLVPVASFVEPKLGRMESAVSFFDTTVNYADDCCGNEVSTKAEFSASSSVSAVSPILRRPSRAEPQHAVVVSELKEIELDQPPPGAPSVDAFSLAPLHPLLIPALTADAATSAHSTAALRLASHSAANIYCEVGDVAGDVVHAAVLAAHHRALEAGVFGLAAGPLVLLITDSAWQAEEIHAAATVLHSNAPSLAEWPFVPSAALYSGKRRLAEDVTSIAERGGRVSPVVVGTLHRINDLARRRVVSLSSVSLVLFIGVESPLTDDIEFTRVESIFSLLPQKAQVIITARPTLRDDVAYAFRCCRAEAPEVCTLTG
jgi:hypothetical protein